jgi:hypothetical protein
MSAPAARSRFASTAARPLPIRQRRSRRVEAADFPCRRAVQTAEWRVAMSGTRVFWSRSAAATCATLAHLPPARSMAAGVSTRPSAPAASARFGCRSSPGSTGRSSAGFASKPGTAADESGRPRFDFKWTPAPRCHFEPSGEKSRRPRVARSGSSRRLAALDMARAAKTANRLQFRPRCRPRTRAPRSSGPRPRCRPCGRSPLPSPRAAARSASRPRRA